MNDAFRHETHRPDQRTVHINRAIPTRQQRVRRRGDPVAITFERQHDVRRSPSRQRRINEMSEVSRIARLGDDDKRTRIAAVMNAKRIKLNRLRGDIRVQGPSTTSGGKKTGVHSLLRGLHPRTPIASRRRPRRQMLRRPCSQANARKRPSPGALHLIAVRSSRPPTNAWEGEPGSTTTPWQPPDSIDRIAIEAITMDERPPTSNRRSTKPTKGRRTKREAPSTPSSRKDQLAGQKSSYPRSRRGTRKATTRCRKVTCRHRSMANSNESESNPQIRRTLAELHRSPQRIFTARRFLIGPALTPGASATQKRTQDAPRIRLATNISTKATACGKNWAAKVALGRRTTKWSIPNGGQ